MGRGREENRVGGRVAGGGDLVKPVSSLTGTRALRSYCDTVIKAALAEDVGSGDITTLATVKRSARGECDFIAKEGMVVSGLSVAERTFKAVNRGISFQPLIEDGGRVRKGTVIARVSGSLRGILTGERVALNFMQRMSGISTLTSRYVSEARRGGSRGKTKVLDTRKTTPCLRHFERYAVEAGGGVNHRFALDSAILIKDNHIGAAGGIVEAIELVKKAYGEGTEIEVEASTLKEVRGALTGGAHIILLDNMGTATVKKAVALIDSSALVEVSGGITLENIRSYAMKGVDFISVGGLTHSAPSMDISLNIRS